MSRVLARLHAIVLIFVLLSTPLSLFAQDPAVAAGSEGQTQEPPTDAKPKGDLPESPGTIKSANPEPNPEANSSPSRSEVTQQKTGAAAAPAVEVSGGVVSRPAGVAIAPPKQRQVRSFLIKMGLLAGAGVAIGTVAALSLSSPSRVPGSH
jgi:hypothetical protein